MNFHNISRRNVLISGVTAAVGVFGTQRLRARTAQRSESSSDASALWKKETAESPQLFFSHQFKTGDPIQLAHDIRNGLNLTDVKFM